MSAVPPPEWGLGPSTSASAPDLPALLRDVRAAATVLQPVIRETPTQGSRLLSEIVGGPVLLKCENLQRAGSFKIRGAYTRISRLSVQERAHGVVAASAGNHAQGVALAAQLLGTPATVFMPAGASIAKENATLDYGAAVVTAGTTIDEALLAAREFADRTGAVLVHPFDHPDVVVGQGTVGLEILAQCPDVATVVVCTGGGGLLAGVAAAVKAVRPEVRVVGAQAAGAAAYPLSLAAGRPVALASMATMADGIAVGRPGGVPFQLVRTLVDDIVTVSEAALARAVLMLLERAKLVAEPAGVAAVAALLDRSIADLEPPVVAVLSGGNVDPLLLLRIIRTGLVAAGRYLSLRVVVPDRPGGLVSVLSELATADANVVEVVHQRVSGDLALDEVSIDVAVETRGPDHAIRVVDALRRSGLQVTVLG